MLTDIHKVISSCTICAHSKVSRTLLTSKLVPPSCLAMPMVTSCSRLHDRPTGLPRKASNHGDHRSIFSLRNCWATISPCVQIVWVIRGYFDWPGSTIHVSCLAELLGKAGSDHQPHIWLSPQASGQVEQANQDSYYPFVMIGLASCHGWNMGRSRWGHPAHSFPVHPWLPTCFCGMLTSLILQQWTSGSDGVNRYWKPFTSCCKLTHCYIGPYKIWEDIKEHIMKVTYKLELPCHCHLASSFHVSQFKLAIQGPLAEVVPPMSPLEPLEIKGQPAYRVKPF